MKLEPTMRLRWAVTYSEDHDRVIVRAGGWPESPRNVVLQQFWRQEGTSEWPDDIDDLQGEWREIDLDPRDD